MQRRELLKFGSLMLGASVSPACGRAVLSEEDLHRKTDALGEISGVIERLSELILPETDTPGAIAAGVPNFVTNIVTEWYTDDERNRFMAGIEKLQAASRTKFSAGFVDIAIEQQTQLLDAAAREAGADSAANLQARPLRDEKPFFLMLRELVVLGYFTSEVGATQALTYNPVPGSYDGAYPVEQVGTHWSS
ncbi:MAG: gluconate 2-dehydrogenase subunit 3 family protein [Pseudomonadales bacterium]|jgi:hypothetical protein